MAITLQALAEAHIPTILEACADWPERILTAPTPPSASWSCPTCPCVARARPIGVLWPRSSSRCEALSVCSWCSRAYDTR